MGNVETWALESHNLKVLAIYDAALKATTAGEQQEQQRYAQAASEHNAAVWQTIAESLKPKPMVQCTTTQIGGTAETSCR